MSSCQIERAKSKYVMGYKAPLALLCRYYAHFLSLILKSMNFGCKIWANARRKSSYIHDKQENCILSANSLIFPSFHLRLK